jgi:hypothetical protein
LSLGAAYGEPPLQTIGGSYTPPVLGWEIETGQSILAFGFQQISHTEIFSG